MEQEEGKSKGTPPFFLFHLKLSRDAIFVEFTYIYALLIKKDFCDC